MTGVREVTTVPALGAVCRVTFPVADVARSAHWYHTRLGYRIVVELIDDGRITGVRMRHPGGGPELALRLDPGRAALAAGFDSFVFGVPDRQAIEALGARLSEAGEPHGGVHATANGWVLPLVSDPDGRELRFATIEPPACRPEGRLVQAPDRRAPVVLEEPRFAEI